LHALQRLHQRDPAWRSAFEVEMVGGRESHNDQLTAALGLEHCVRWRDYVPHRDAIAAMQSADVLVLIKHVEPRFRGLIPGKLYEYMGAGRPILALVPDSEAADLVRDLGWGEVAPPDDPEAIAAALLRFLAHKRAGRLQSTYPMRGRERFERAAQTAEIAAILDTIASRDATVGRSR
jgi:glycosyltransferase involved in cell wall biosynthesis